MIMQRRTPECAYDSWDGLSAKSAYNWATCGRSISPGGAGDGPTGPKGVGMYPAPLSIGRLSRTSESAYGWGQPFLLDISGAETECVDAVVVSRT